MRTALRVVPSTHITTLCEVRSDGSEVVLFVRSDRSLHPPDLVKLAARIERQMGEFVVVPGLPAALRYDEVARQLGVSVKWLRNRVAAREVPFTRVGVYVRFSKGDVEMIREGMRHGALPPARRRVGEPDHDEGTAACKRATDVTPGDNWRGVSSADAVLRPLPQ